MADDNKVLYYLDDLSGYKVASDYSDVRGWKVKDANNRIIGKVDNLMVNKRTERVVYLDVEVDTSLIETGHEPLETPAKDGVHQFINKDGENHLIIPIGLVHIDDDNKYVYCSKIDSSTFSRAKRYKKGEDFDFEYEKNVLRTYRGDFDEDYNQDDFYNRDEFDYRRDHDSPI
jgi:sporulation protein YlmC with PRC-barrel domain